MASIHGKSSLMSRTKLPDIRHPLSQLGNPEALSVRGISAAGQRGQASGLVENPPKKTTSLQDALKTYRTEQLDSWGKLDHWVNLDKKHWGKEEGKDVPAASSKRQASLRAQCDQIQHQLFEKINSGGFYQLKNLFWANDPEARGRIPRDSLPVILATFLGHFVSTGQCDHLLQRLHLGDKPIITFEAFYEGFKREENNDPPDWLDPMKRKQRPILREAHELHLSLKNMAANRYLHLMKLFPEEGMSCSGFRNALSKLGLVTSDKEFEKLWNRYVGESDGILEAEDLLSLLGITDDQRGLLLTALEKVSAAHQACQPKTSNVAETRKGTERKLSLNIEKWLRERVREGARAMAAEFLLYDPQRTGKATKKDFLKVLETFSLTLPIDHLDRFLCRCGLDEAMPDVNYLEFLQHVQARGRDGVTYTDRSEKRTSPNSHSTTGVLEEKLAWLFHEDFRSLLGSFRSADTKHRNAITQQDFRAIIEKRYGITVTDAEFARLLEKLPTDHHGGVRYLDFMARIDSSDDSISLYDGARTVLTEFSKRPNTIVKSHGSSNARSLEQLTEIIKNMIKHNYGSLELAFIQVDDMNTRRLTVESLYQLLKRCNVRPSISREDVGKIWETFILNRDQTVSFCQFVRHFGFSPKSSCFPNANVSPPVKGDGDFLIRSRKLNSDTKIIANMLQTKVMLHIDELWELFKELDPLNTGCVTKEEFLDIVQDLSPDLTRHQCESLAIKLEAGENSISYVQFLQPYQHGQAANRHNGYKVPKKEAKTRPTQESVQQGLNVIITSKLREKLSRVDWKNLHQACQKLDRDGSGLLQLPQFRSLVKLCNVVLDEDDIYRVMSQYDKDLSGKINYLELVSDHKEKS
uniref:EF-hand domain-containing protein n=1 Tax=Leptobrachium leishanense TaxID=445787 RepID=A0A8C5R155_9ANUR